MNIMKNIAATSLILTFFVAPFFADAATVDPGSYTTGLDNTKYNDASNESVADIVIKVINWLLGILAALAVLVLIIAGIMYILSGGDEGKVETAKTWIIYAIIGLIIALLGYVIVSIVSNLVAGTGGGGH